MFFRIAAGVFVVCSTPLIVFFTGQISAGVLPDSVAGSQPALRQDAIVRLVDQEGEGPGPTTTSSPGGSPCPPCQFAWPPPHVSAVGRFALQLLHDNDVDFDRLVCVWLVLYGAGAGLVGWAVGSICRSRGSSESRRAERAGSLAHYGFHQSTGSANGAELFEGPRGGVYHMSAGGNRMYHEGRTRAKPGALEEDGWGPGPR